MLSLTFPVLSRFELAVIIKKIYMNNYRNIIQFDPDSAIYDPDLTYTLKPGVFNFSNTEFNNEFRVNSIGLRDDEESLKSPKIIVYKLSIETPSL